jgi:hypothetical protein
MRRSSFAVVAVVSAIALAGCEGMITGGPLLRPGEPTGVIEIVNATGMQVDAVAISDCDASTYGFNRLPDGASIAPGRSYRFTVSAGCWDVAAGAMGVGDARQRMQVAAGGGVRYTVTN